MIKIVAIATTIFWLSIVLIAIGKWAKRQYLIWSQLRWMHRKKRKQQNTNT